jgi:hypothetical protein
MLKGIDEAVPVNEPEIVEEGGQADPCTISVLENVSAQYALQTAQLCSRHTSAIGV